MICVCVSSSTATIWNVLAFSCDPLPERECCGKVREKIVGEVEGNMVITVVYCPHCGSEEIVRNGKAPNGKQKYRCKACKKQSREHPTPHAYPEERREEILRAYEERSSLRGIARTFGVSRTSVIGWMKKKQKSCQR